MEQACRGVTNPYREKAMIQTRRHNDTTVFTMGAIQVRKQTFDDVLKDTPLLDLPIVFSGMLPEVVDYCKSQPGFTFRKANKQMFGGFFYKPPTATEDSECLMLT
jgi:hypothetical protein